MIAKIGTALAHSRSPAWAVVRITTISRVYHQESLNVQENAKRLHAHRIDDRGCHHRYLGRDRDPGLSELHDSLAGDGRSQLGGRVEDLDFRVLCAERYFSDLFDHYRRRLSG